MVRLLPTPVLIALWLVLAAGSGNPFAAENAADAGMESGKPARGQFLREYWYEEGIAHGNPKFNNRFRVNAPEAVLHPSFQHRSEVRGNGMMLILIEEEIGRLKGAELYCEIWGGHPGTAGKRVSVNGRSTYRLPRVGTEEEHCTHQYPTLSLKRTDLVNGYNAIQFACDSGESFWGHFIVDNACLRCLLEPDHPDLESAGLAGFNGSVGVTESAAVTETLRLTLDCKESHHPAIASVTYHGFYEGYDENGNRRTADWHGFTKDRRPVGVIGGASEPPFEALWDTSMIPDQETVAVRAVIHFKEPANLFYRTAPTSGIALPPREGRRVALCAAQDLPAPFWSRASRAKQCMIPVAGDPARIERAQLHVVVWDGGRGTVEEPFRLNGHALPVAGSGAHDVLYRLLDVPPEYLRGGDNTVDLVSDTNHHGIEVLLPGPALVVREVRSSAFRRALKPH